MEKNKYKIINTNFSEINESYNWGETYMPYKNFIYWGSDNLLANRLLDAFNNSAIHSALVRKKVELTSGKGWVQTHQNKLFIENPNGSEDLNDIIQKMSFDLNLFGISYANIIFNADNTFISQIEHVPAQNVRVGKSKDIKNDFYLISRDWQYTSRPENKPIPIIDFDQANKEFKSQLLCVREYVPGCVAYSLPDYFGASKWIYLDNQISIWHQKNVDNNFSPSVVITYKEGIPTSEEQRLLYKSMKESFSGAKNAGDILLTFSESDATAPNITTIDGNNSDTRYRDLMDIVIQQICSGHRCDPAVAGIQTPGKLGNTNEIIESEIKFFETVIEPKQKILERAFNKLSEINGSGPMKLVDVVTKNTLSTEPTDKSNLITE